MRGPGTDASGRVWTQGPIRIFLGLLIWVNIRSCAFT